MFDFVNLAAFAAVVKAPMAIRIYGRYDVFFFVLPSQIAVPVSRNCKLRMMSANILDRFFDYRTCAANQVKAADSIPDPQLRA